MTDIDRIVDEILRESVAHDAPSTPSLPDGTVLFTVPGDLTTFSRAMERIRSHPAEKRAVMFCESIEQMLPDDVLRELAPQCAIVKTGGCVPESLLTQVERVVIPALSERVADRYLSDRPVGMLPAVWQAAARAGVPVCAPAEDLDAGDLTDAVACARAKELARQLLEQGVVDLSEPAPDAQTPSGPDTPPELELVGELVHHLCDGCETEDGTPCSNCGMCRVRGF